MIFLPATTARRGLLQQWQERGEGRQHRQRHDLVGGCRALLLRARRTRGGRRSARALRGADFAPRLRHGRDIGAGCARYQRDCPGEIRALYSRRSGHAPRSRTGGSMGGGPLRAAGAWLMALTGYGDAAISLLATVIPALERGGGFRQLHVHGLLRCRRTLGHRGHRLPRRRRAQPAPEVVEPDFRCVAVDGRLSLARLCASPAASTEASEWFARARRSSGRARAPSSPSPTTTRRSCSSRRAADGDREAHLRCSKPPSHVPQIGATGLGPSRRGCRDRLR
jgi:hypothetical protein